jgi:YVTN family beta-propeller protein
MAFAVIVIVICVGFILWGGPTLDDIAVNPVTNKIYVSVGNHRVAIIDGATNATSTVAVGRGPGALGVNPATNKVYVANANSEHVTVIDGATNATATIAVGRGASAIAVNPATDKVYVANARSDGVTVIDGSTNGTATVAVGHHPDAVAVNPVSNKIYVTNAESLDVTVIDGATNATSTVDTGLYGHGSIAVNPITNKVYIVSELEHFDEGDVKIIDGTTNAVETVVSPGGTRTVALNPATNKVYVTSSGKRDVLVLDGATKETALVPRLSHGSGSMVVNSVSNKIYVTSTDDESVTEIDGATNGARLIGSAGLSPGRIALNANTDKIYVNQISSEVTVIDGATSTTTTVKVADRGRRISGLPIPALVLFWLSLLVVLPLAIVALVIGLRARGRRERVSPGRRTSINQWAPSVKAHGWPGSRDVDRSNEPRLRLSADGSPLSPDGRWRWTGSEWVPHTPPPPPIPPRVPRPTWVIWEGLVWAVFLVAWIPVLSAMNASGAASESMSQVGLGLGVVAALTTLLFGARLGSRSETRQIRPASLIGAGLIIVALMVAAASLSPEEQADSEGGAELVILFYPFALAATAALLFVGAAAGRRFVRNR